MEIQSFIILLYLIVVFILLLAGPRWALLFFFATKFTIDIFWDYPVVYNLTILKITGVLFPLLCFAYFLVKRPMVSKHPLWNMLLILFALNILAGLWGILNSYFRLFPIPHTPLTIKHILDWNFRFFNLVSAFLIVPFILTNLKDKIFFLRAFLISTIVPFLISCYQLRSTSIELMFANVMEPYSVSLFHRLDATYHDSGTLSLVMFTAIILCFFLIFIEASKPLKVVYLIYSILCSIILYFTFSRTLWISLILFLLLFFLFQRKYLLMSVTAAIAVTIFTLIPLTQKRFERELVWIENNQNVSNPDEIEKLGAGRIWLWNDARKHFLKLDLLSKLTGSGGSFGSHNQYISWLLRNGMVGLTVWLFFLYKIGKILWLKLKENNAERTIVFVIVLFWLNTGIINSFMQPWDNTTFSYFFWGTMGLFIFQNNPTFQQL